MFSRKITTYIKNKQKSNLHIDRRYYVIICISLIIFVAGSITFELFTPHLWFENKLDNIEKNIIVLTLETAPIRKDVKGEKYTVVRPQTKFNIIQPDNERREYIKKKLKIEGYDITFILDELFEKNKKSVPLDIQTKLPKGYKIDFENKFNKYFEKEGGSWTKLHEENPNVFGLTNVSRPAYDKKNGIVLIYIDILTGGLSGYGMIFAYKYDENKLTLLGKLGLWVA